MPGTYEVVVVGLGGMGSAALYHLARTGVRVLGLEQFTPQHDLGSSHGESRIIRQAYFEGPEYVPLLWRAYTLWDQLQEESQTQFFQRTGGLFIGQPGSAVFRGSLGSAQFHRLPHEVLSAAEMRRRFPLLQPTEDLVGLYETQAGYLRPEAAIGAHLTRATQHGATARFDETVLDLLPERDGVTLRTTRETIHARRVIVTGGAWMGHLVKSLRLPLQPERVVMHWFAPRDQTEAFDSLPVHLWEVEDGTQFYGFPALDRGRVKIAFHNRARTACDPGSVERMVQPAEVALMRRYLERYLPLLNGTHLGSKTCLYTMTPDEHFVVGLHPDHPSLVLGGGFSGHGFKFASVMGEVLAELACEGRTRHGIGLFSPNRFKTKGAEAPETLLP